MSKHHVVMPMIGLAVACGCSGGSATSHDPPPDPVVARWEAVLVRASDVRLAMRGRPAAPPADVVIEILVDEVVAARARTEISGAAQRAAVPARRVAIDQMLDAEVVLADAEVDRYYRDHADELTQPAQVRLAHIVVADCAAAQAIATRLTAGGLDFAVAAMQQSTDQSTRLAGGDLGWHSIDQLADGELAALPELDQPGAVSGPIPDGGGCRLVKLIERRAAATPDLAQSRAWARMRLVTERRGEVRRAVLARLGGAGQVHVNEDALTAVLEGREPADPSAQVLSLGDDGFTAAELRAGMPAEQAVPGGASRWRLRLAEELVLWREARRRGTDRSAAARAAGRASLVAEQRDALWAPITPEAIPATEVRAVYDLELGDYTTPRRVKIAGLVTRDSDRATGWVKTLRAARAPADALLRLLPESEDAAARARDGDMGWVDGRTTQYPESFKAAALMLPRPGAVSGVVVAAGVHHVLLCVDVVGEHVSPFADVEPTIRARLAERRRREVYDKAREDARGLVRDRVDAAALAALTHDNV